jgi:hypothetical protein
VLSPLAFLRRLAALIPPKRIHTVRHHGVFSPASLLRPHVLPRFERGCSTTDICDPLVPPDEANTTASDANKTLAHALTGLAAVVMSSTGANGDENRIYGPAAYDSDVLPLPLLGQRVDEAELLPIRKRRLDWATLLRRVYRLDVLKCPRCEGRLEVIAAISDPDVVRRILDHLGLPSTPPQCKPARAPPDPMPLFDH